MTTKGISAYPGDHYFDYVAAARETAYHVAVQRAVKMADHFLNLKADGSDVTPFKHFFPQQGWLFSLILMKLSPRDFIVCCVTTFVS